jgi:YHS domain-containing protein
VNDNGRAYNGRTYYFCAVACREVFVKAPARYVASERRHVETRERKGAA